MKKTGLQDAQDVASGLRPERPSVRNPVNPVNPVQKIGRRQFLRRASGLLVPMLAAGIAPAQGVSKRLRRSNYVPTFAANAFTTVDVLIRPTGTDGVAQDVTNLNDSTYGLSNGSWSIVAPAGQVTVFEDNGGLTLPGLALSDGSGYSSGTTCLRRPLDTNPDEDYPLFTFSSSKATICYGFAFKMTAFSGQFDTYNIMRSDTSGGSYLTPTIDLNNNDMFVYPHAAVNGSSIGPLAHDTWHWVAIKRDQSGTSRIRVYELPSLTEHADGESTTTQAAGNITAIRCGWTDDTGHVAAGENLYWGPIAMRFADVHPLLPTI